MKIFECKFILVVLMIFIFGIGTKGQIKPLWTMQPIPIPTRWAKDINPNNVLPEYPRPQMVRNQWQNLNGLWYYSITEKGVSIPLHFDGQILVPYPIESALSGVKRVLQPSQLLWYKRSFKLLGNKSDDHTLLHFGAVDWETTIYINGKEIGTHTGGYQSFTFDITAFLKSDENEILVKVYDPTDQGINPHGKQVLKPQGIMYTQSSGIWQTVWLEKVPSVHIEEVKLTPDVDNQQLKLIVNIPISSNAYTIEAITANGQKVMGEPNKEFILPISQPRLWSPSDPYLYNLSLHLLYKGKIVDTVGSYFGMRKIEVKKDSEGIDRIFLNNMFTFHLGVLDQGYWPDGLYTAPTDDALLFDITAIRNMGYNTIRKHIKIEPARWYYYADKLGVLVWQDMINPSNASEASRNQFEKETEENIKQLYNHPCIVVWVLFNEGWGTYNQAKLTKWVKNLDGTRIVDGHSGENYFRDSPNDLNQKWFNSDLTDVHEYPGPGISPLLTGKARVLGEWGGIGVSIPGHLWDAQNGWGYINVLPADLSKKYEMMIKHLKIYEQEGLSASIYTEPFDVELENNGMMTYDREVIKIPDYTLREIHSLILPDAKFYVAEPGVFSAQVMDTSNPYRANIVSFLNGRRDRLFMRDLVKMSTAEGDTFRVKQIVGEYIESLKWTFDSVDIKFISNYVNSSIDPAFKFILEHAVKIDSLSESVGNIAIMKIREVISKEECDSTLFKYIRSTYNPDFEKIQNEVVRKYGALGERVVWAEIARYNYIKSYYDTAKKTLIIKSTIAYNNQYIANFVNYKNKILGKYPKDLDDYTLNTDAWFVFVNATDRKDLESAILWIQNAISNSPNDGFYLDTYANLLYKIGFKDEAIRLSERAVNLNGDKDISDNLYKMKNGIPTWY